MINLRERLGRVPPIIALAWAFGLLFNHLLLYAYAPRRYWQTIVLQPDSVGLRVGSFVTYFEWAITSSPLMMLLLSFGTGLMLGSILAAGHAIYRGEST